MTFNANKRAIPQRMRPDGCCPKRHFSCALKHHQQQPRTRAMILFLSSHAARQDATASRSARRRLPLAGASINLVGWIPTLAAPTPYRKAA